MNHLNTEEDPIVKQIVQFFLLFSIVLCLFSGYTGQKVSCLGFCQLSMVLSGDIIDDSGQEIVYEQDGLLSDFMSENNQLNTDFCNKLELSLLFFSVPKETNNLFLFTDIFRSTVQIDIVIPPPDFIS